MNNEKINSKKFVCPSLKESYEVYSHPSGLDIYLFPKKLTSTYAIFGTKYGSIDNTFKTDGSEEFLSVPDGIAHFLEHKLFANEDGSDSFEHFSDLGADANAYTSFNKTSYLFSCTDNFAESLEELLTFVTHPYFTEESVKKEQGIIAQEIKMYDDSPADRCFYGMLQGMYEKHSIRRNICGSVESIAQITPELLYGCYNVFYDLSNMALVISGNTTMDVIKAVADKVLPRENKGKTIVRSDENSLERRTVFMPYVEEKMTVSKPMFCIGIKDVDIPAEPYERQKKDAMMSILDEMLFSRCTDFYNDLIEREIITPAFSYGYSMSSSFAYNSLAGEADSPKLFLSELKAYLSKVAAEGLRQKDFERAKRVMYAEYVKLFDSTESIANTLFGFICEDAEIFSYDEILKNITFEEVCGLFGRAFKEESFTLSVILPQDN